jgi:hypothetical protein
MLRHSIETDTAQISLSSNGVDYVDLIVPLFKEATVRRDDDSDVVYFADIWDVIRVGVDSWWILDFYKYAAVAGGVVAGGVLKEVGKDIYTGFKGLMKRAADRHKKQSRRTEAAGFGGVCVRFAQKEADKKQRLRLELYFQESEDDNSFNQMFETLEKQISPIVLAALNKYGSEVPYEFIVQMGRGSIPIMVLAIGPIELTSITFPPGETPLVKKPSHELAGLVRDAMHGLNLPPR